MPDTSPYLLELGRWAVALWHWFVPWSNSVFGLLIGISFPVSLFFLIGIIYTVEGLKRIRDKEAKIHDLKVEPAYETVDAGEAVMAHRWESAMKHIGSANMNDWKQAIIEADILLDNLLTTMGYRGESVGEKLQRVESGDMKSLQDAWEAHKVRNQIAHEPGFQLDHHTANQTIHHYRRVFEEFRYI
ncbi:MAG: hypothetical protein KGI45_03045 [Patescibacteria group bacterium]|nr:hypothetical protein [Patescibacteria group bacterium]MDE1941287.1 hypothetical protein [Patescibacteria group bacterium]MDE1967022.1 hypothetical protein [Patescibacteria group bacterium]